MHELAATQDIIQTVIQFMTDKGITQIKTITLELGGFTNFQPEPIHFYFTGLKASLTGLSDSELVINFIPGKIKCNGCQGETVLDDPTFTICPNCESFDTSIISGKSFLIKSIAY